VRISNRSSARRAPHLMATRMTYRQRAHEQSVASANTTVRGLAGARAITLWIDARDIAAMSGDLPTWPSRVGTPPTQTTGSKQPEALPTGWSADGGPCVEFDGVGEAMSTGQLLNGTKATVAGVYYINAGAHLRVFWEQTQQYNGNNGYYFGSITNAASGKTIAPLAGAGGVGPSNYIVDGGVELSGTGPHCIIATHDRTLGAVRGSTMNSDGVPTTEITLETTQDVTGNFQPGTGSYLGSRNNAVGGRFMNGAYREFVVFDDVAMNAAQKTKLASVLLYKAALL
jgi:hypothetical protein